MKGVIGIIGCLFCLAEGFSQKYEPSGELLWEVDNGKTKSYLWGTLHSNDKELFSFPDSLFWAFQRSNRVAVEVDLFTYFLDKNPIIEERTMLFDQRGKLYTSSDEPTKTYYGTEDGMPQFMDAFFQEEAERAGKTVVALETPSMQTQALRETPFFDNDIIERSSEKAWLKTYYFQGRIAAIDQLIRSKFAGQNQTYRALIEKRNQHMADRFFAETKSNSVFCAVGVGHLYGEKGLINLMRGKGYRLRPMSLTISKPNQRIGFPTSRNVEFLDTLDGSLIKATFPGVPRKVYEGLVFKELGQGNTYELHWYPRDTAFSLLECAELFITPPLKGTYTLGVLDDGTEYVQGLSDAYPERLAWKRVLVNEKKVLVISCQGGNKFMNSDRPAQFFNSVVIE